MLAGGYSLCYCYIFINYLQAQMIYICMYLFITQS